MHSPQSRSGQSVPLIDAASMGSAIRLARQQHHLTQAQLAGLAGTGLRFVSELERGKPNVALNKTLAVLAALGLRLCIEQVQP